MLCSLETVNLARVISDEDRDPNATDEAIPGPYKDFARLVRRLTYGMSTRAVYNKTGVNFSTVSTMLKGSRANQESLIKFARAFKMNPNVLLELLKKEPVPEFDKIDWSAQGNEIVTIAPGRTVRVIDKQGESSDVQLTPDAINMILSQQVAGRSRDRLN